MHSTFKAQSQSLNLNIDHDNNIQYAWKLFLEIMIRYRLCSKRDQRFETKSYEVRNCEQGETVCGVFSVWLKSATEDIGIIGPCQCMTN